MRYADWWPDYDQDQHAEIPHPENHDQHEDLLQAEKPRSACGKPTPPTPYRYLYERSRRGKYDG